MPQKTVLVVEDDRMLAEGLSHALMSHDVATRVARNGEEALTILAEDVPDLILTDIMMPKMSGTELLQKISANEKLHAIPVIVLTNADDMETVSRVVGSGGNDYLIKAETSLADIAERVLKKLNM